MLPVTSLATNPAVTITEYMNISISVSMSKVSGDNQQAQAGTTLPQAFVVKIAYSNGTGVPNLPLTFAITQQPAGATGARLSANEVTTDSSGQAQVTLTLGDKAGQYQVTVSNSNISNSPVVFTATAIGGGEPGEYVKDENPDLPIGDYQTTISTLNIPDNIKISEVEVYVDITHTWIGDLIVTLISPSGKQHILHNRSGGSSDNIVQWYKGIFTFMFDEAKGDWQLKVEDQAGGDTGSLNLWKLKIIPAGAEDWKTYNYTCESPHNYSNNYTNTWVIEHPGASKMRVYFTKIDVEPRYDYVIIYDKNNQEISRYSSYNLNYLWSPVVPGDIIKIKLTTDYSVVAYGFKVDKYQAVGGSPLPQDTTPPAQITNLSASEATMDSIKLTWTAPGDDGNSGQATSYDIRYSTSPINDTNWADATQVENEPIPQIAGTTQNITITGLQMNTLYYFGLKTQDEVGNTSLLSNIASLQTKGPEVIEVGGQASGNFDSNRSRWYRLYLASETKIKIILSMDSRVDYDLYVYSGNANSWDSFIASSYLGIGQTDQCTINASGYIWIKVYHYVGSGNYTLSIKEASFRPPQDWITTNYVIESPHPYSNYYDNTWIITESNATTMSVHFSQIDTEGGYDFVYIYDGNNTLIDVYDGYCTDIWTPPVPGNTVKIRLKTDYSVTRWGFKVDKYACPLLRLDKVRVYYHNDTEPTRAYPFDNDILTVKAFVWVNDGNGTKTYCNVAINNDGRWYAAGSNGIPIEFDNTPALPANTPIYQWPTNWQTPSFNWTVIYHHASDSLGNHNRNYWYTTQTSTVISGWGITRNYTVGTRRYSVTATLGNKSVNSPNNEYATRISVRSSNTPQGHSNQATDYLRWLTAFLQSSSIDGQDGIPYEWGGHWFGGMIGNGVGGADTYDGYGIDCSGLVSCGARFAGYGWNPWRRGTGQLPEVSDEITPAQVQPGDILNKSGSHVVTVYEVREGVQGTEVKVIEAAGNTVNVESINKVWIRNFVSLQTKYLNNGYTIRRLR